MFISFKQLQIGFTFHFLKAPVGGCGEGGPKKPHLLSFSHLLYLPHTLKLIALIFLFLKKNFFNFRLHTHNSEFKSWELLKLSLN